MRIILIAFVLKKDYNFEPLKKYVTNPRNKGVDFNNKGCLAGLGNDCVCNADCFKG